MSNQKVLEIARKFVGLHEIKPNAQWTSKDIPNAAQLSDELIVLMKKTGWLPGWAYCAAFVDAVYREAFKDDKAKLAIIKKCISPAVMTTYKDSKKYFSLTPTPGCIFIMQMKNGGTGHCGIVGDSIKSDSFSTIEGNTGPGAAVAAKDREGDGIYAKARAMNFKHSDGLHLLGFIDFKF
jgi:hypothetical protein